MELTAARLLLSWDEGRVYEREWQLTLPNVAPHLEGLCAEQVRRQLGLLYRLCGQAQLRAAVSLQSSSFDPATEMARDQAVWLEWLKEHGWQLYRAHTLLLGESDASLKALVRWQQSLQRCQSQLPTALWQPDAKVPPLSIPPRHPDLVPFLAQILTPLLTELEQRDWFHACITPEAEVQAMETGSAARQRLAPATLGGRFQAMANEMQQALTRLQDPGGHTTLLGPGVVSAARGQLRHQAQWQQERVQSYHIEIPSTDLLFSLRQTLAQQRFASLAQARGIIPLLVLAYAPCLEVAVNWWQQE